MKRLDIRFPNETKFNLESIGGELDETISAVAREAMDIGIGIMRTSIDANGEITLKKIGQDQFLINNKV